MFRKISSRAPGQAIAYAASDITPDESFWAVGDIHGRVDLLLAIEKIMLAEAPGLRAVFVGDYIDRGDHSADVLRLLASGGEDGPQPITCLMGNHEAMLLDFIDAPDTAGPIWLRNGGLQTLTSFGLPGLASTAGPEAMFETRDALLAEMGTELVAWLRARPLTWQSGNVLALHAGVDPSRSLQDQSRRALLYGHPAFGRHLRSDGMWILHGHTITREPAARDGRISVDTGAYATGHLTAALVTGDGVRFFST